MRIGGIMGLAEDLKALQELRDKGELSESSYAAARDAAIGKQTPPGPSVKAKPMIGKPVKVLIAIFILFVGLGIFARIYDTATTPNRGQSSNLFHQGITITDEV